jgi:hypothetical protein
MKRTTTDAVLGRVVYIYVFLCSEDLNLSNIKIDLEYISILNKMFLRRTYVTIGIFW